MLPCVRGGHTHSLIVSLLPLISFMVSSPAGVLFCHLPFWINAFAEIASIQTKIPALPGPKLARRGSVKSTVKVIILHAWKTLGWYAMGLIDIFSKWY